MISLIYTVNPEQKDSELEWLRDQKIYPGIEEFYSYQDNKMRVRFGVIVSPEAALSIKLRHRLDLQMEYSK